MGKLNPERERSGARCWKLAETLEADQKPSVMGDHRVTSHFFLRVYQFIVLFQTPFSGAGDGTWALCMLRLLSLSYFSSPSSLDCKFRVWW